MGLDQLESRGRGVEVVRGREQEALERTPRGQLEPRVAGQQIRRWARRQLVVLRDIDRQFHCGICGICLEILQLGNHLLDPQTLAERDTDGGRRYRRLGQDVDDLIDGHCPREDVTTGDEVVGGVPLDRLELKGPRVGDDARSEERTADLGHRFAVLDLKDDLPGVRHVDGLGKTRA